MKIALISLVAVGVILVAVGIYIAFNPSRQKPDLESHNSESSNFSQIDSPPNITIPAKTLWYDTGIDVNNSVKIEYLNGKWTNGGDEPIWSDANGNGSWNGIILPSAPFRGLLGKINSNVFFVGNKYEGNPGRGRLYLSINDNPKEFADNLGQITVAVMGDQDTKKKYRSINLSATQSQWLPIGKGHLITKITGFVTYGGGEQATADASPRQGDSTALVPNVGFGQPVAKIGETGKPFKIGSSHEFNTQEIIYIAVNDSRYEDNSGSYQVEITER